MKLAEKLNGMQLFSLIILFEFGTAIVVGFGLDAENDAWITILLGMVGGILLYSIYTKLYAWYPHLLLTGYIQKILGKWIGWPIGFMYVLFFISVASRDLRDAGGLLYNSTFTETPTFVLNILMIITIIFILYYGIDVLGRLAELSLFVIVLVGIVSNLFILVSGIIHLENLMPVLSKGWEPIIRTVFTQTLYFPFGEMVVFVMFLPYVKHNRSVRKIGITAIVLSGSILCLTTIMNIIVLGVDIAVRSTFPLLSTIEMVEIGEFIQRLDTLAVLTLIICVFFKIALFIYGAVLGAADLFNLKVNMKLIFPIGMIVLYSSMMIASNFSEHLEEGKTILYTFYVIFMVYIPVVLFIVAMIRKRISGRFSS